MCLLIVTKCMQYGGKELSKNMGRIEMSPSTINVVLLVVTLSGFKDGQTFGNFRGEMLLGINL